jgi:hypothetical protein
MAETATREHKPSPPKPEVELEQAEPGRRLVEALRWGLPVASLGAAGAVGAVYGLGTAILVLAGGVLLGVIAILWASVRTLAGDAPITLDEAMALGAPSAAEEQKRAVLQALKDLEYERSMGKIAEADYEDLLRRYRAEAKRLLRAVDEDLAPLRARAAAYLTEQLGPQKAAPAAMPIHDRACPSCKTDNDPDALFCKKCGAKLVAKERHDATA